MLVVTVPVLREPCAHSQPHSYVHCGDYLIARHEGGGEGARDREEIVASLHVIVSCYCSTSDGTSLLHIEQL